MPTPPSTSRSSGEGYELYSCSSTRCAQSAISMGAWYQRELSTTSPLSTRVVLATTSLTSRDYAIDVTIRSQAARPINDDDDQDYSRDY